MSNVVIIGGGRREQRLVHDVKQAVADDVGNTAAIDQPVGVEESQVAGDNGC
jgi:hypothetical protein